MKMNNTLFVVLLFLVLVGCNDYYPKPHAFPRVIYPEKNYKTIENECPFSFEIPEYSELKPYQDDNLCWFNLEYTLFNATLHLSYIPIKTSNDLDSLAEDAYKMVFKPHLQRAEEIIEREIQDSSQNWNGMIYDLEGKTATPFNFYITDGENHFFRGSFYFNERTNRDSVLPIYEFLNEDIIQTIETFKFK